MFTEICWMGTTSSSSDEWIELYNKGTSSVDISGWSIESPDGTLMTLEGSIPGTGYFLLERTDDDTVSNIEADQIYTGSLLNSGEKLRLKDATGEVIDTANSSGGGWPAGLSPSEDPTNWGTMERVDLSPPEEDGSWAKGADCLREPEDSNGNSIHGTPKRCNCHTSCEAGTLKWIYDRPAEGLSGSPVVGPSDTIYIGSYDNRVHQLGPGGELQSTSPDLGDPVGTIALGTEGTAYIGLANPSPLAEGSFLALSTDRNSKEWTAHPHASPIYTSPVIDPLRERVYFAVYEGTIYAVEQATGNVVWTFDSNFAFLGTPSLTRDSLYAVSTDGKLSSLNISTGESAWTFNTGDKISGSPAIDADGNIYVGSDNGKLYALSSEGKILWSYSTSSEIRSSPTIGPQGVIYFGSNSGKIYALRSGTDVSERVKWTFSTSGKVKSSPLLGDNGALYCGSEDGKVYALNREDGSLKWSFDAQDPILSNPVLGPTGTLYVQVNDESLYALRTVATELADSPWPMYQHDIRHSGHRHLNRPPEARLRGETNRTIALGKAISLDGSLSRDPEDLPSELNHHWKVTSRPTESSSSLSTRNSAKSLFVPDEPGNYEVDLEVSDSKGETDRKTLTFTVEENPDLDSDTLTHSYLQGPDPAPLSALDKAGVQVEFEDILSAAQGAVLVYGYERNPLDSIPSGHPLDFLDVKVTGFTTGEAKVAVAYRTADLPEGAEVKDLLLRYYYQEQWHRVQNLRIERENGLIRGTIPVDRLRGTVLVLSTNQQPEADFSYSPTEIQAGDQISFSDQSTDPDGTIESWDWRFDDGETSSLQDPVHTYSEPGEYEVRLEVTDNDGLSSTKTRKLEITEQDTENEDPGIRALEPEDGDICGSETDIRWKATDPDGPDQNLSIDLHWRSESDSDWKHLATDLENDGQFTWTGETLKEIRKIEIKVTAKDGEGESSSDISGTCIVPMPFGESQLVVHGPNPVPKTGCRIWLNEDRPEGTSIFRLFDLKGQLLLEKTIPSGRDRFPYSGKWIPGEELGADLGPGLYFYILEITTPRGETVTSNIKKMVISH